jgi:hypothetical protein
MKKLRSCAPAALDPPDPPTRRVNGSWVAEAIDMTIAIRILDDSVLDMFPSYNKSQSVSTPLSS